MSIRAPPYQNWIEINYSANAGFANYQGLTLRSYPKGVSRAILSGELHLGA